MRFIAVVIFLSCLYSTSHAQITLTSSDFLSSNIWNATTYSNTSDLSGAATLIAQSGTDQTWTFPAIAFTPQAPGITNAQVVPYSTSLPLATDGDFTTATHVVTGTSADLGGSPIYEYLRVTNDGVWLLGIVVGSGSQASKFIAYSSPEQVLKFPLTYQTSWTSTFDQTSPLNPGSVTHTSESSVADAWGTLVLPQTSGLSGTSFPAVRVKTSRTEITTAQGFSDTAVTYSYQWYTKSDVGATINASADQTPSSIEYTVPGVPASVQPSADNAFGLAFSQNPVSYQTNMIFSMPQSSDVTVQIMDMLGSNVRTLPHVRANAGLNSIALDASELASGTYFVRLSSSDISTMRKLVIAK